MTISLAQHRKKHPAVITEQREYNNLEYLKLCIIFIFSDKYILKLFRRQIGIMFVTFVIPGIFSGCLRIKVIFCHKIETKVLGTGKC